MLAKSRVWVVRHTSAIAVPDPSREVLRHIKQFCWLSSKEMLALLKEAVNEWSNDKAPRLGAAIAFYTLLSLAPLLIVIVTVAALAFGKEAAEGQLFWQVRGLLGPEAAKVGPFYTDLSRRLSLGPGTGAKEPDLAIPS